MDRGAVKCKRKQESSFFSFKNAIDDLFDVYFTDGECKPISEPSYHMMNDV